MLGCDRHGGPKLAEKLGINKVNKNKSKKNNSRNNSFTECGKHSRPNLAEKARYK